VTDAGDYDLVGRVVAREERATRQPVARPIVPRKPLAILS
jgi:hypothetical protein